MMRERAEELYIEKDYNCAETTLRLANEAFGLGLDEKALRLIGGFGGGFGCGSTCGALCGAMAAISSMTITERAHATENFKAICADYVAKFDSELGSTNCERLKEKYHTADKRCLKTVQLNADMLEEYLAALGKV